jgi:AcrR family transcriptional regulator
METSTAILQAARNRYARFGPRKTTMAEVARDAGCSRATLYTHFPGKNALYAGLLEAETQRFHAELEVVVASAANAGEKLRAIVETTARCYADNPVLRNALAGDNEMTVETVAQPVIAAYEKRVVALLQQVLDAGVAEGSLRPTDTEAVADLTYRLGRMLVLREAVGGSELAFSRLLRAMDDLVAHGIQKSRSDS